MDMVEMREGMRVAIPTYKGGLDDEVCEHFGRAPTFTVVDIATNEYKIVPNTGEHFGGSRHAPEILAAEGVSAVICSNLGPRAIQMLSELGIKVFVGASGTVRDALRDFSAGRLREASYEDACRDARHAAAGWHPRWSGGGMRW